MDETTKQLLDQGKVLPLMEEFYTLQGEGFHTGSPAYFTRIGGCDVGCRWCDIPQSWNADKYPPSDVDEIVERASSFPAKSIVVTGGEPLLYNLDYFCSMLHKKGVKTFLETSGSSRLSGSWDWLCLSPKKDAPPLHDIFHIADELKVIIQFPEDLLWAEENAALVSASCILYLQPEWSKRSAIIPVIVDYIQNNPSWKISLQSHKYMRIP